MQREYAWSKKGQRVTIFRPGRKFKRINIVAATVKTQNKNKVIAPFIYRFVNKFFLV
jgi:hypothetical protein